MHRFREPVSGFTHLAGALLGIVGLAWLVVLTWQEPAKMLSMIVYGVSLVLLYSASAALHLIDGSPRTFLWLKRFDHAAIYALIAGSYTPLCYNLLTGGWRWGLLGAVWALAVVGIVFKLFFLREAGHLSTLAYVGLGSLAVFGLPRWLHLAPPGALWLLIGGGALYLIGAFIFSIEKPNLHPHFGFHEIWHLFVLGGSALHFAAVLIYAT
ncbi:MAG: PAQR family membrane homeostasis protein TrhA [Ardenticatenaceae bacterium]